MVNAKALWESLERKYKTEDAGSKKFVVGKFLDFKMVDSKTVISQVQEFQLILHDIHAEGMVLGESFQVAALIEKLPPTWKDFKNYLKHKRKEMKLEDLIVRLRIEEDNRQSEKKAGNYHQEAKANVVEQDILPMNDKTTRPPGTISSERDLRNNEKSFWNCTRQQNTGNDTKMPLKSLPGRSFKDTLNSGIGRSIWRLMAYMAPITSKTSIKVLGPDEQPRSAMPMLSGESEGPDTMIVNRQPYLQHPGWEVAKGVKTELLA
ncbi:hypothetical protein RJ639_045936 [Escallonia herrerae]|uniref:Zinc finger, CCHC-type n=2 Tax=Escallonia herrerae TaxID=1293975 RepID=A0AA88W6Y7_9ASTE|nr:hypothetical protein RJ639_045936 [Escallonia herrerae]